MPTIFFPFTRFIPLFVLLAWLLLPFPAQADPNPSPLRICNDEALWPPFVYREKETGKLTGASVEIVEEIFRRKDIPINISLLPWKRCLNQVEFGLSDAVFDISSNEERCRRFLISTPLYQVQPVLFYLKEKYPHGPRIESPSDLRNFRIGSVLGYNIRILPLDTSHVNSGAKTVQALFQMLRSDRIDLALYYYEAAAGFADLDIINLTGLSHLKVPDAAPLLFHMMVAKKHESEPLLEIINDGIRTLRQEGLLQQILDKYELSNTLPHLPREKPL